MIDFLLERFNRHSQAEALVWQGQSFNYHWLISKTEEWTERLKESVSAGRVVAIEADFSPHSVALLLALIARECIVVPLTRSVRTKKAEFLEIAEVETLIAIDDNDESTMTELGRQASHELYGQLRARQHSGLILFSSGSTGKSKAAVHDFSPLLEKFRTPRKQMRVMSFLLYDHIGGINTLLYTLSNCGCLVTVQERTPEAVLDAVSRYQVELLPTSPTFLNLMLVGEAYQRFDLHHLKMITYGTEPMPESTLSRLHQLFPHLELLQTYGLSELGILRSKSKSSDSLWVKIGGEGFKTRVVNGLLQIKAQSAMLGYLNAPSPFDADGWFNTMDQVEVDGEYFRILGRQSEIINVGGEKVYPAEVESVIRELPSVQDATVYGEKNLLMGQIVVADIRLSQPTAPTDIVSQIKKHCGQKLQRFKVPVKINLVEQIAQSERFKKLRPQI